MGMASSMFSHVISGLVTVPIVIYVVARWRTYRDQQIDDPHLGLKVALLFFRNAAFQLALVAGFLLVLGIMTDGDGGREQLLRSGGGLLVPSLLIYGIHAALLQRTNFQALPSAVRMFDGVNLVATGVPGMIGLAFAMFLLFQQGVPDELHRIAWSVVLVFVPAWVVLGIRFGQRTITGQVPAATARYGGSAPPQSGPGT